MDENKTPDTVVPEKAAEEVTEVINGEATEALTGEPVEAVNDEAAQLADDAEQTADSTENAVNTPESPNGEISNELRELQKAAASMQPAKKKHTLMTPIIISLCIVIIAAAAALFLMLFFNKSVEGCWYHEEEIPTSYAQATNDEPKTVKVGYYFKFESGNKLTYFDGSISSEGTYELTKDESDNSNVVELNFFMPNYGYVKQSFKADVSGNIFTGQTMKLTSAESSTGSKPLEFVKKDFTEPELKRDGDFVADKEIEGKWVTATNGYGEKYVESYELKNDGTFVQSTTVTIDSQYSGMGQEQTYTIKLSGIYSCEKGKLELAYKVTGEQQKQELPYTVKDKGNVLTLTLSQNVDFYKAGSPSADEVLAAKPTEPPTQAQADTPTQAATQPATEKKK